MDAATHWRPLHRTGHAWAASMGIAVVPRAKMRVFKWAGLLARMSPKAPAAAALRCRSLQWWRWKQFQVASASQVPGAPGAHPRRFRIMRWEEQITAHFLEGHSERVEANTGWLLKAQNENDWKAAALVAAAAGS